MEIAVSFRNINPQACNRQHNTYQAPDTMSYIYLI